MDETGIQVNNKAECAVATKESKDLSYKYRKG